MASPPMEGAGVDRAGVSASAAKSSRFSCLTSILVDFGDFLGDPARGPDTDQTGGQGQIRSDTSPKKHRSDQTGARTDKTKPDGGPDSAPGFSFPRPALSGCILTPLHVQNGRLGSAPAADPGKVLASVHRLEGQDVPSGGGLAGEQPGRSRGAAVSRSGRSTELA